MVGCHDTPPTHTAPFNRSASLQEQVSRALQANFLLLHQPAPNSFIILDPSPTVNTQCQWETGSSASSTGGGATASTGGERQRFRVTLGGHAPGCTCAELPLVCPASTRSPCAHILFILLRVFRLRLDDPRITKPRLENYEVEPLLQRYTRLKVTNFRSASVISTNPSTAQPFSTSSSSSNFAPATPTSTTARYPQSTTPPSSGNGRIAMPRPVVLTSGTTGPTPCLLAAVRASLGSSECSELSSITKSIATDSRQEREGARGVPVCRRCLSHASSSGVGCGGVGRVEGGGGCGARRDAERGDGGSGGEEECESWNGSPFERRPKTEPQSYYETLGTRMEVLNSTSSRHVLSTSFRPIGDPGSNPETDPETEGISSSSRSSRFEEHPPPPRSSSLLQTANLDATLTSGLPSRRSISPIGGGGGDEGSNSLLCRLCLRELRSSDGPGVNCASAVCVAGFHQECFTIWQEECENGTAGTLYCPVCGRMWTAALTPTNPPEGPRRLPPATAGPPPNNTAPDATSVWAPAVTTRLLPPRPRGQASFPQEVLIAGLKDSLVVWKSSFSEEVAMGIISSYWHVRQSALRQVAKITICRALMARKSPPSPFHQPESTTATIATSSSVNPNTNLATDSLRMSFRLIQYLLSDPADEVFIAALCAFREILGYLICLDTETMTALQRTISPVLRRLLIFVGGYLAPGYVPINNVANLNPPQPPTPSTSQSSCAMQPPTTLEQEALAETSPPPPDQHRRANLALATLVELAKGQEGEMSIGRDTSNAEECMPISGLPHLAHFLLRSAKFHQTHLVGRLKLLEKLVEMHREAPPDTADVNKRISYRHLCSSLIFARRHVYPPDQPVFPHNYVSEEEMSARFGGVGVVGGVGACGAILGHGVITVRRPPSTNGHAPINAVSRATAAESSEVYVSTTACLMEANIKASRLARRVFIAVARALLTEKPQSPAPQGKSSSLPQAESFVTAEIAILDVSLAAKLRSKLSDILGGPNALPSSQTAAPASRQGNHHPPPPPPIPPPRRFSKTKLNPESEKAEEPAKPSQPVINAGFRVAPEPAYDHVALSETAPYSSGEEDEEEVEEEPLEKLDWEEVGTGQQPKRETPSLPTVTPKCAPLIPTTEELSALKTALRRSACSPMPLVPIPNLPQALDSKEPLKTEYKYKEGVDWLLGPFLGRGAFSQCYQARDMRTGTLMAVKRLRFMGSSSREAMEQLATATEEAEIMRRLYHPNVLRLFGIVYNPEKRHVDIFVEWMPGGSITSLLNQYGAFTESVSIAYTLQVVRGILCLHKHGILHRDLKGANLLVDSTGGIIRISDFGASARLGSQGSVAGQFQGQVIGTFAFMAPEVLRGETYGRACDIWSVGCCLLEMLSGKPPWNDSRLTNQYALMFTIASAEHPPSYPKAISVPVKNFLDSCFNRVPEQRPTARRLLQNKVFSSIISATKPPSVIPRTLDEITQNSPSQRPIQGLSKSFTAASLTSSAVSCSRSRVRETSRHRALPPVPSDTPVHFATDYDALEVTMTPPPKQLHQQQHHRQSSQQRVCRNQ